MLFEKNFIDVVFAIDCTASMDHWIAQVKTDIQRVVDDLGNKYDQYKLRLGCIGYRDWSEGDKRIEALDFTEDINQFKNFIQSLKAFGGGDGAEDVLGGLNATITLNWSESSASRILFHICDAPPHNRIYHDGNTVDDWPNGYDGGDIVIQDPNDIDRVQIIKGGDADPYDYHRIVLNKLKFNVNINHYCIVNVLRDHKSIVDKMITMLQSYASEIALDVKEKRLNEPKTDELKDPIEFTELLAVVEETIFGAIAQVDPTTMTKDEIKENFDSGNTWQPIRQQKNNKFQAYVGIDFGTDGTGFAYALPSGKVVWQQDHTPHATLKDRTNILLEAEPPHHTIKFGLAATKEYTNTKEKTALYFDRFKMALYDKDLAVTRPPPSNPTDDEKDDEKDEKKEHEEIEKLKSKKKVYYLKAANGTEIKASIVFQRALEEIRKIAMKTLSKFEIKREMQVQWILTVPAIWSNYAKEMMKEAAQKAKLKRRGVVDHLLIATEPECASIIARQHIKDLDKIGTKYIMLDLGGGTADIACHKTIGKNQFQQIYAASGGKWGSSYIDIEYEKLLIDIFGTEIIEGFKRVEPNKWIDIKEKFRKSKHHYDGSDQMNIDLNNSLIKYIEKNHEMDDCEDIVDEYEYKGEGAKIECDDGTLTLDKCVWTDLFKCVVEPIMNETAEILKRPEMEGCKDILLSGGLSQNKYLRSILRTRFGDSYNVHEMPRPILAVVEGAAVMGLKPNSIATWYAKESIGLQITRDYDAKIDNEEMKRYDNVSKKDVIDCGFGILVKKGTPIDPKQFILKWFRPWKQQQETKVTIKLYSSDKIEEVHTTGKCAGEKTINLPSDFGNKPFPVVYWDKGSEKRLYIAHPNWKEEDREINIEWKNPFE